MFLNQTPLLLPFFIFTCMTVLRAADTCWSLCVISKQISVALSHETAMIYKLYLQTKLHTRRAEQVIPWKKKSFPPRARKSNPSQHVALKACTQSLKPMYPRVFLLPVCRPGSCHLFRSARRENPFWKNRIYTRGCGEVHMEMLADILYNYATFFLSFFNVWVDGCVRLCRPCV